MAGKNARHYIVAPERGRRRICGQSGRFSEYGGSEPRVAHPCCDAVEQLLLIGTLKQYQRATCAKVHAVVAGAGVASFLTQVKAIL
jgi:hypothetical protein